MKKAVVLAFALAACMVLPVSAKKKSVQIKGIEDLDGKRIGVQGGTTGETYVQENLKNAKLSSFKSGMDAALDLMNGQIDAIVLDELPAKQIVSRNSKKLKIVDSKFAQEEYSIAVKKGNSSLLESINKTIASLKANGGYEELVNAFMPADGVVKIPGDEVLSGKVVKLGTNADMSFDSLIPALSSGAIDFIAAGMSVTEERKKNVDFSEPYFTSNQVIIVRK